MKKILLSCFLTWCFCFPLAFSKTIKDIQIKGNAHIEKEAICNEIPYKCGSEYDESTSNQILKILNKTGYFDDVSVFISNDIVFIDVVENPTIRQIAYEGMNFKMKDALKDMVKIKKRQVLSKPAIQETQQLILEMYRRQGYLSASVTVKIVKLPNNNVDVVFEVKDGSPAYVRKISFIGNKALRSSDLRESMEIKEKKWFHLSFLGGTRNKIYDPEKFVEDQQMLVKYYMALGYADFEIVSANAELSTDKKNFFLTYYLKEGEIYKFGKITVESKIPELDAKFLQAGIIAKEGALFNGQMIELCGDILKSLATARGYNFAAVAPVFKKDPVTKTVDVCFVVKDGPKVSVEKVVIKGNRHTRDSVIRAEIDINEGDPYDTKKMKRLEERIKGLGFFKNVRVEPEEGSDPDHAVLVVTVDEEKTGEAFVKGGWSSLDHLCIEGRIFEPNFRGKGQSLEFSLGYAGKVFEGSLELAEPNLFGNRIYGSATLFHTRSKKMTNIKRTQTGIGVTMGYHLSPRITQTWGYRLHRENVEYSSEKKEKKVDTGKTATEGNWQKYLKTDEGKEFEKLFQSDGGDGTAWGSAVTHTLSYDRRNRRMLPSKGFRIAWTTKVSGLGGSIRYMINTWSGSIHQKIYKDIIFTLRASFSHACGIWGKPLRKPDALYLGGDSFRGFDFFGVSPVRYIAKEHMSKALDEFIAEMPKITDKTNADLNATERQKDPKKQEAFDKNVKVWKDRGLDINKLLVSESKDKLLEYFIQDDLDSTENLTKEQTDLMKAALIICSSLQTPAAMKIITLRKVHRDHLGGTLSWNGSAEVTFPMPVFPRDAEVFGTIFLDTGSVWRSKRLMGNDKTSVLHDDHKMRAAAGFSVAWNSPFGMISVGYAWPFKKQDSDETQKFLFGYGTKLN